jgi:hypothetical protein
LTLSSSGGVTFGAAATTNTITSAASTALTIQSAGTTAIYVDTSQNVGIGTSSPTAKLTVNGGVLSTGNMQTTGQFLSVTYSTPYVQAISTTNNGTTQIINDGNNAYLEANGTSTIPMVFRIQGAEKMRIDTSGNLLVGTTTSIGGKIASTTNAGWSTSGSDNWKKGAFSSNGLYGGPLSLINSGSASDGFCFYLAGSPSQLNIQFGANGGGLSAGVYLTSTGTSWAALSDERLKTDLIPISDAANKVSTLRAVTGRYKTDEIGESRSFLIAQDVQKVLPEAIDASDPDRLGVRYTEVIPLLVAAIQELSAKVDAQAAEITALKAKVGA